MDIYSGTRYQAISDSDYTKGIDGYINLKKLHPCKILPTVCGFSAFLRLK